MAHVYVALGPDVDGCPPYETEEIDAVEVCPGRDRLEGVPIAARGMAGDLTGGAALCAPKVDLVYDQRLATRG